MFDPAQADRMVLDAVRATSGDMKKAAVRLGVARRTLYRWCQTRPELLKKCRAIRKANK
jgi:transcriptional regulator of acetoin/glycerol metabolism